MGDNLEKGDGKTTPVVVVANKETGTTYTVVVTTIATVVVTTIVTALVRR